METTSNIKIRNFFIVILLLVGWTLRAQTNCASQPSGLVNWWQAENNAVDSVGGRNGTMSGSVSYATGKVGNAFAFVNGNINFGTNAANFGTGSFTLEFWLRTTAQVSENYQIAIMERRPACNATLAYWSMRMGGAGTAGKLHIDMASNGGQNPASVVASRMINDGIWHHVAFTRSGGAISMYLDGILDSSQTNATTTDLSNPANFVVGQSVCSCCDGTQVFSGYMDEISIYSRALTASEILGIFNAGTFGKCNGSAPVITQQPASITAQTNSMVGFTVVATGTSPLSYQWSFDSNPILGATNSGFTIGSVQLTDAGSYSVLVSNSFGTAQSSNAILTVTTGNAVPPNITQQPVNQTVYVGQTAQFSVGADGTAPLSYGWTFNGGPISGATGSALTIPNAQFSNAGTYAVVITNQAGSATSANATLTVLTGPSCSSIPGMIAWWPGGGDARDVVGTNNGTVIGGLSFTDGVVGSAFTFNGSDSAVSCNATIGNFGTNDFSIEFWLQSVATSQRAIMEKWPTCGSGINFWDIRMGPSAIGQTTGQIGLELSGDSGVNHAGIISTNNHLNNGQWHHVAFVRNQTNLSVYIDGNFENQTVAPIAYLNNNVAFRMGQAVCQCCDGTSPLNGSLDEVSMYGRALTAAEIQSIYLAGSVGKCGFAPVITVQPTNIYAAVGSTVNIGVGVSGTQPLGYSWFFNATNVYFTTASPLVITNVQLTNAGTYYVVVTNAYGSATSSNAVLVVGNGPALTAQPSSQTALQFTAVTFNANGTGDAPLAFQWQRNAVNISAATNATYTIPSAQTTDAASYRVVVTNGFGATTSSNAVLSVFIPNVRLENAAQTIGPVTVPLRMRAGGSENSVSVSVSFPSNNLIYASTTLGSNAAGALLTVNTNQVASGKLGLAVFFPDASNFGIGTQELARITFRPGVVTNAVTNALTFGDVPAIRQVLDTNFNSLVTLYSNSVVTMPLTDYEGDVSPRTNGNHTMTISDWTQTGRFVAGLDVVSNTLEMLRADCAPRTNGGDGRLSIADWVQAGRYALGFDPVAPIGGATNFTVAETPKLPSRPVTLTLLSQNGVTNVVAIHLNAQGDENALGFSLSYDPAQLSFVSASIGSGVSGAVMNLNSTPAVTGHVGLAVAMAPGNTFAAGDVEVARVTLVSTSFGPYTVVVGFGDQPILREITDANATTETASYGGLSFGATGQPLPQLSATLDDTRTNIVLSWNAASAGFNLESNSPLGTNWSTGVYTPVTNGANIVVTQAISADQVFYRLHHP